ncbi:hypothetical protein ACQ7RL_003599 [Photobacterium damselae]
MSKKALAIMILYYPDVDDVINKVELIKKSGTDVILFDNTDSIYDRQKIEKVAELYHHNFTNVGLDFAFNKIVKSKLNFYDYFVFFDQDSDIETSTLFNLLNCFHKNKDKYNIGIMAAYPERCDGDDYRPLVINKLTNDLVSVKAVPSSYSIISKELFLSIGEFQSDFFIDFIDYDYSLRARDHSYLVVINKKYRFKHNIGNGSRSFFGIYITPNSTPFRHYYQIRNSLMSHKRRGVNKKEYLKTIIRRLFSLFINCIFEPRSTIKRVKYFCLGLYHFYLGKMGKLND